MGVPDALEAALPEDPEKAEQGMFVRVRAADAAAQQESGNKGEAA